MLNLSDAIQRLLHTALVRSTLSVASLLPLAHKVALLTGGSRSIGAAIAKRLASDGAIVALTYSASADKAAEVARAIESGGGRALAIAADAGKPDAVREAIAQTISAFSGLDILVNNAGINIGGPITQTSQDVYEQMIAVNVNGAYSWHPRKPHAI